MVIYIVSVVKKKIGRNEYAYLIIREGKNVVYKYLGSTKKPHVVKIISDKKRIIKCSKEFKKHFHLFGL